MANTSNSDKWYFTKEQLENIPSRKCGYDSYKELSYRQQAANFIQDMGQRLKVSQLCINTAIVYMHRFYVFHSFTHFPWHQMSAAAIFLAAKVEEQPRKLEYVIRVVNVCRNPRDTNLDINSERYIAQSQDLVFNENVLLQTLGFDVAIDHPHTHVVRCCNLVRASKDLAQTSYFMANNSLHLTTMCIQYKPTVVACFCILVACKWSNWEIPLSNEKKEWYSYVDPTVTAELLQQLTEEFLVIFESCPSRLKEKILAIAENVSHGSSSHINSPFDQDPKKVVRDDGKDPHHRSLHDGKDHDPHKHRSSRPHESSSSSSQQQREREYRERKERERLAQQHGQKHLMNNVPGKPGHSHHKPPVDPKMKPHSRPPSVGSHSFNSRQEPRDILREASRDSSFGIPNKDLRDPNRDHSKEQTNKEQVRSSDKDAQKQRDYLLKHNVTESTNSVNSYPDVRLAHSSEKRVDPNRMRPIDSNKFGQKHDSKAFVKSDNDIKKQLSANVHDKNSAYMNKSTNSTSQKVKSPFNIDSAKSVPKQNVMQNNAVPKPFHLNGNSNSNGSYNLPTIDNDVRIRQEVPIREEVIEPPPQIKRPSLFSPEKTPPHKAPISIKSSPDSIRRAMEPMPDVIQPNLLSPLTSPVAKRNRNYSSSSEPELRPVMKKIDQVEGFENIMRDTTIGTNKLPRVPDIIKTEENKEEHQLDNTIKEHTVIPSIVNGIETNPTLISNLLKEAPVIPHLPCVAISNSSAVVTTSEVPENNSKIKEKDKEHHHHKSKKKNKEKHKHKDKEKNKEEKEKKKKHKDREKHKHKKKHVAEPTATEVVNVEPIKIKIPKDKILPVVENAAPNTGLKIKIPKDKIKTEDIGETSKTVTASQPTPGGLKIKISKEVINNCASLDSSSNSSKKRERDKNSYSETVPPSKISKNAYSRDLKQQLQQQQQQNGRHPYSKVSNYQNKNSIRQPVRFPPQMPPNHMPPPPRHMFPTHAHPPPQFFYHPHPIPNMSVPPPPTYMYTPEAGQMYAAAPPYYNAAPGGFMPYQQPDMYLNSVPNTINTNPPLPMDAPPDVPPPPPPE